jgi:molybdopterin synthase catalytic subunit
MKRTTTKKISLDAVINRVRDKKSGAIVLFLGSVRGTSNGRKVLRLEYEAHIKMAEKALKNIEEEARKRTNARKVAILHRLGRVKAGELCTAIAASAAHRDEAFQACRFCIDNIKRRAFIWKKEVFSNGGHWKVGE